MKKLLVMLVLVLAVIYATKDVAAQVPGTKIKDLEITILDTLKLKVGDILILGQGSGENKSFIYFFNASLHTYAASAYAGYGLKIKFFRLSNVGLGKKYYATVVVGNSGQHVVDLENAIKCGEVIGFNKIKFNQIKEAPKIVIQDKVSIADELKKFKDLFDQGVISKDEYDAQKKKLLAEN